MTLDQPLDGLTVCLRPANVTVTFSAHVRNVTDFETVNSMGLLPH